MLPASTDAEASQTKNAGSISAWLTSSWQAPQTPSAHPVLPAAFVLRCNTLQVIPAPTAAMAGSLGAALEMEPVPEFEQASLLCCAWCAAPAEPCLAWRKPSARHGPSHSAARLMRDAHAVDSTATCTPWHHACRADCAPALAHTACLVPPPLRRRRWARAACASSAECMLPRSWKLSRHSVKQVSWRGWAGKWIPPGSTSSSALQKRRTDSWCRAVFHMETYAVQMSCSSMAKPVHRPAVAEVVSVERSPARLLGTEEHSRSVSFRCP